MMTKQCLYLIGPPGVGKSTLMDMLLKKYTEPFTGRPISKPFAHVTYPGGVYLGALRESFPGTDALSMSVQPMVQAFIAQWQPARIVGEGDRLANEKFFTFLREQGYKLTVVYLQAGAATLAQRRSGRGSNQNASWMAGRETKSLKLANQWSRYWLDADKPVLQLAEEPPFPGLDALRLSERSG
jgi:energy-coupling factor transporter ATP-binding protein EcfA2